MRKLILVLGVLGLAGLPALATTPHFYVAPDIPHDLPLTGPPETTALPWGIIRHDTASPYTSTVTPALPVPFAASVNALHLMNSGDWLFSVDAPTDLAPFVPGTTAQPFDVVRWDGATYDQFFCGATFGLAASADIDAAFLTGQRDDGDLVISFEAPTDIGGTTYQPADLVRLTRIGPLCSTWAVAGYFFDSAVEFTASAAAQIPSFPNVTGADERGALTILTFEAPTELAGTTYLPGELVSYDPGPKIFATFHSDFPTWAVSARANAISLLAVPGRIPCTGDGVKLEIDKSATPGDLDFTWSASCSVGAEDYGFYEGTLPALPSGWAYNHGSILCTDAPALFAETITPAGGNQFYLVVPHNPNDEGSYGEDAPASGLPSERPQGSSPCRATQELGCP